MWGSVRKWLVLLSDFVIQRWISVGFALHKHVLMPLSQGTSHSMPVLCVKMLVLCMWAASAFSA